MGSQCEFSCYRQKLVQVLINVKPKKSNPLGTLESWTDWEKHIPILQPFLFSPNANQHRAGHHQAGTRKTNGNIFLLEKQPAVDNSDQGTEPFY